MPVVPSRLAPRRQHSYSASCRLGAWRWWWSGRVVQLVRRVVGLYPSDLAALDTLHRSADLMPRIPDAVGPGGHGGTPHAACAAWGKTLPTLLDWMVASAWPDGSSRVGCRLVISAMYGMWRVTVKEPGLGLEIEVQAPDPIEGLKAMDALLAGPQPPWRVDPWARQAQGRKKR